uniref:GP-PDE domain-containing protein n=1 Tax=Arion vulgaris TaxID=1028688 RepID=A0A0B6Z4N6_9EUPU
MLTLEGDGTEKNKETWKRLVSPVLDILLSWAHWSILWFICGNSFFLCNKGTICRESKRFWQSLGVRMVAWTVNDTIERDYLVKYLEIPVITDGLQCALVENANL